MFADRLIAATPRRIGQVKAAQLVQEARLYFDPDRALADEEAALTKRGVWQRHGGAPATTDVTMTLDTPDAWLFDQTVTRIAGDLKELGDTDELEVRRARAVGILADPQHALDLLSGREGAAPSHRGGATNLYVHLTPAALAADLAAQLDECTSAASIEKLGAVTTQLLTDWLTRFAAAGTKITLRPVLDLNSDVAVDQHDPPDAMRETVVLRDAHCVFPGCVRDSRICDLDHITEYLPMADGGPPGRTRPGNLAPLCRTHHRVKTQPPGTTNASTTAATNGPPPPGTSTELPLLRVVRHLVSSDRSLRSLLDHLWYRPPQALSTTGASRPPARLGSPGAAGLRHCYSAGDRCVARRGLGGGVL